MNEYSLIAGLFGVLGLACGALLHYIFMSYPALRREKKKYDELVGEMLRMKKQGFVPQFDIEQEREIDLSKEVPEY